MKEPTLRSQLLPVLLCAVLFWTAMAYAASIGMARVDDCAIYCADGQHTDFCCENCDNTGG